MDLTFFKNNAKVYEVSDMNVCTMLKKSGNELGQITRALGMPDLKCPMPKVNAIPLITIFKFQTFHFDD